MSEVITDKLTGRATAGDVTITAGSATMQLQQGVAKAWVNFNGTGTIASRDSFNVTSLDDNGTGNYDVNFTNDMGNADFSSQVTAGYSADTGRYGENLAYNASFATVGARNSSGSSVDNAGIAVTISGDLA